MPVVGQRVLVDAHAARATLEVIVVGQAGPGRARVDREPAELPWAIAQRQPAGKRLWGALDEDKVLVRRRRVPDVLRKHQPGNLERVRERGLPHQRADYADERRM